MITTDGNLSNDGRHLMVTAKDREFLEMVRECLGLTVSIGFNTRCHRLQWGHRAFYDWLVMLGLMPAKSRRLGALAIPDAYFADFLRGYIDGDGSIITYIDRYNTRKKAKYVYERLFVKLVSASLPFLEWVHATVARLIGVRGSITVRINPYDRPVWTLCYAKKASLRLLRAIYYANGLPCLVRKWRIALPFLVGEHEIRKSGIL